VKFFKLQSVAGILLSTVCFFMCVNEQEKFSIINCQLSIILLIVVFFSQPLKAQVTIGMSSLPVKGALLDLKQREDLTGKTNSSMGMMLPRVLLTDMNTV